ncbi:unnamed protein product [Citrullus colocynthis]|uniref:Uncharacterized protein n=1 Tax=Citrullus colocynthis TaxID=252529 RepID=A0ABP0XQH6_9ROSI
MKRFWSPRALCHPTPPKPLHQAPPLSHRLSPDAVLSAATVTAFRRSRFCSLPLTVSGLSEQTDIQSSLSLFSAPKKQWFSPSVPLVRSRRRSFSDPQ